MALIFEQIRGGGDNLAYVVGCSSQKVVAVVDPVCAHDILEFCGRKKLTIAYVFNTHGHPDHTSGNDVITSATGARVLAHSAERILNVSRRLKGGETIPVGKHEIKVIHTPGHTEGGLCLRIQNKFLSGDTVFLAGAGNTRFGGSIEDLYQSFLKKIIGLSGRFELYPGHDYAETNLRFARTLEPDNPHIDLKLKKLKEASRNGHVVKSNFKDERSYNPFFRFKRPELIESLRAEYPEFDLDDPFAVFKLMRELRNHW